MGTQFQQGQGTDQQSMARIDVFLMARGSGPNLEWDLGTQNPPPPGKEELDLPQNSGPHQIVFHLLSGGPDVDFNPSDPIWVQEGGSCPPANKSTSGQVTVTDCKPNKLTIEDQNSGASCQLIYQLNFTGGAPACDPTIRNGGNL